MEIRTSKIKSIDSIKTWESSKGTIYYHNLELENGDKINIGKKSECKIGWEITYSLTGKDDGQQEFKSAKSELRDNSPQQAPLPTQEPRQSTYVPKKVNSQVAAFALSYAKDIACAKIRSGEFKEVTALDVCTDAQVFLSFLNENA